MNYFIFDGESSLDYGVYIGGQNTFNAPQRDVEKVAIPGRNGDLVQDNGRFLNVQVPYNIVVMDSFRDKTDAIKAWLLSKKGYCKLVDTYHPGTYRMAMVAGGIDFETAAYNLTGRTQVIFDCKPERFLDSGDEVFNVGEAGQSESASGSVATFEGDEDEIFAKMQASITPTQDLHGYDYPWPPGGGKNILESSKPSQTINGVLFSVNPDGSIVADGIARANAGFLVNSIELQPGDYVLSGSPASGSSTKYRMTITTPTYTLLANDTGSGAAFTISDAQTVNVYADVRNGYTANNLVFKPMIRNSGTSANWEPYDNICPITGQTEANVYHMGRNLFVTGKTPGSSSTSYGITFTYNADGTITLNGRNNGAGGSFSVHIANFRLPPGTYKKPVFRDRVGVNVRRKVSGSVWEDISGGSVVSTTFTITEDDAKYDLAVRIGVAAELDFDFDNFVCEPYIYKDGEPLTYEKPNYTRYPVSWQREAGEVYGGTVDVVSGLLTVDRAYISTTWGALLNETTVGTMIRRRCMLGDDVAISGKASISNITVFDARGFNTDYGARWLYDANNAYFYLPPDTSDSQEIAFVYFLATPQTHQLSANQIKTLLGVNNVWANTGDVYVEWLLNPNILRNPTRFESRPKIRVKGSGSGTLTIENGTIVVSNLNEYVDIDSEMMNCYKGTANKNADVALPNHEYPELHPGGNYIDFSGGISAVEVQGRWWTI